MKLIPRRKKPSRLEHVRALGDLQDAMGRAESGSEEEERAVADECQYLRTPSGRIAHLRHPRYKVLCGWRAEWVDADPSLDVCRLCLDELHRLQRMLGEEVAS